jgi:MoaA/NifB/PqqE/SkfB family radical SAM enzyme
LTPDILHQDTEIETVTLALNYVCNSRCRFCFIERELDLGLPNTSEAFIAQVFEENARRRIYRRLILAGAEATLRKDLPEIAHRALKHGGFDVVRLQTNGRRLADRGYLWSLLASGISELFVSVHAGTSELDAHLTRNPRGFVEMRQGLRNAREVGARVISNTAVSRSNHAHLPEVAEFLIAEGVPECHFWAFIEFGDIGQGQEHVSYATSMPYLREAVRRLVAADRRVVLSWFPECQLGPYRGLAKNHRDNTLIHDEFSQRVKRSITFSCVHQDTCPAFGTTCIGLHERYVATVGDERALLRPIQPPNG